MNKTDTITALATPTGYGGVGIIRLSGPESYAIALKLTHKKYLKPRYAHYTNIYDSKHEVLDQGITLYFKSPHSFTGEDVVELQMHGGPILLNMILDATLQAGARLAEAGEFSQRAFLNDKIDLVQAESIADLINSQSIQATKSAQRSLSGVFSNEITILQTQLIQLRMHVESAIDFPEEEIDFLADETIAFQFQQIQFTLNSLLEASQQGAILSNGINVVILGKPNAGKSSLLNALTQEDTAIVTNIPGTTRDILKERILIDGVPIHIIDTAGLRKTDNIVEEEGIKRAIQSSEKADHILYLIDANHPEETIMIPASIQHIPLSIVYNKCDLLTQPLQIPPHKNTHIQISAKHKKGLEKLKKHLLHSVGYHSQGENTIIARTRHVNALKDAAQHLQSAHIHLQHKTGELLAEELRLTQQCLSKITGEYSSDDLLGEIFSSFCIGK